MSSEELKQLLSQEPSARTFADIVSLLDHWSGADSDEVIERVESALQPWPDIARQAPEESWQLIQQGEPPPPWWPLVRHLRVAEGDTLDVGPALDPLTSVDASRVSVDPAPLQEAHHLRSLDLAANEGLVSLEFLAGTPYLARLVLSNIELLPDISPIGRLSVLDDLDLGFNPNLEDISCLAPLTDLHRLDLAGNDRIVDFNVLAALSALETLILNGCAALQSFTFLSGLKSLRIFQAVRLPQVTDLRPVESTGIETLHLGGRLMAEGSPIGRVGSLVELVLTGLPSLGDLSFLNRLRRLQRLGITACNAPLPALDLPALERFWVEDCPHVRDLNGLVGLQSVRELLLNQLPVTDLTPLAHLSRLERLWLTYCRNVHDLSPLSHLPLRQIDLTGCDPGLDTTKLPPDCRIVR